MVSLVTRRWKSRVQTQMREVMLSVVTVHELSHLVARYSLRCTYFTPLTRMGGYLLQGGTWAYDGRVYHGSFHIWMAHWCPAAAFANTLLVAIWLGFAHTWGIGRDTQSIKARDQLLAISSIEKIQNLLHCAFSTW
jgi:hypothetical protein